MLHRREFLRGALSGATAWSLARTVRADDSAKPGITKIGRERFGVLTYSFGIRARNEPGFDEPARFARFAVEHGFGGVQSAIRHRTPEECRSFRQAINALGMYVEGIVSLPKDANDVDRFDADLRTATACGVDVVRTVMLSGRRYEVFHSATDFADFQTRSWRSLQLAEPVARRHRVQLAVENHKDYRSDEFVDILKRFDSEYVGVCLDTGNNIALLEDPWQVINTLAPWTRTVHLKDMAVEEWADGFLLAEVPLGAGLLDLPRIVDRISAANPRARFNLEMMTRDPLRIPCFTDGYWATMERVPGQALAQTLRLVKQNRRPAESLPRISSLAVDEQIAIEERHVAESVAAARRTIL